MTLLEKAKKEHPELGDEKRMVFSLCPADLGYPNDGAPCLVEMPGEHYRSCEKCWNREAVEEKRPAFLAQYLGEPPKYGTAGADLANGPDMTGYMRVEADTNG